MKCKNCASEWQQPIKKIILFCPFCGEPLIKVQRKIEFFDDAIVYIVNEYGEQVLLDNRTVLRFVEYYLPNCKREFNFLKLSYSSGYIEAIIRIKEVPTYIQQKRVEQIINQFSEVNGISLEWAHYIISSICNAVGIANDLNCSIIKLEQLADSEDVIAQFELAKAYYYGTKVKKNDKKYLFWLNRAADNGYPQAVYQLGKYYRENSQIDKNIEKASINISKAIRFGELDAILYLAFDNELQKYCDIDIRKYIDNISEFTDKMTPSQLVYLSRYYFKNNNIQEAKKLAKLAYDKDIWTSWEWYVEIIKPEDTIGNKSLLLNVLRSIASEGNLKASKMLANIYEKNAKSSEDMKISMYWHKAAAELGDLESQIHLAEIYEAGKKIPVDIEKAAFWYRVAAYNGSTYSKSKVSYKSKDCILKTIDILYDDDSEQRCIVENVICNHGDDYLIIREPDTQELVVLKYIENDTLEGYEIEEVDEYTERSILLLL